MNDLNRRIHPAHRVPSLPMRPGASAVPAAREVRGDF
jgi:hypothetical protein